MLHLIGQLKVPPELLSPVKIYSIGTDLVCIQCNEKVHILHLHFAKTDESEETQPPLVCKSNENENILLKSKVSFRLPSLVLGITIADSSLHILTSRGISIQSLVGEIGEKDDSLDDTFETVGKHSYNEVKNITEIRYKKRNVQALASIPDELVICAKDLVHNVLSVELLPQGEQHRRESAVFSVSCDNLEDRCEELHLDPFENQIFLPNWKQHLLCVATRKPETFYSHIYVLDKEFFISLFSEPNLIHNIVILLALADGKVVWYPVRQNISKNKISPYLLCDLSQPIASVFCTNFKSPEDCADSIVIVGSEGKMVTFTSIKDKSRHHTMFGQLESSVHSCTMWKNFITYISLDSQLYGCEISEESSHNSLNCHCYKLPISGAIAVSSIEKDGKVQVICLTSAGYLYMLPICSYSNNESVCDSSDFQNVLKAISSNAKELSHQQSIIKQQRQILSQLGIALDLAHKKQTVEKLPFSMQKVKGLQDTFTLSIDCKALNELDLCTEWWHFVVTVKSKHQHHTSYCKSIPFGSSSTVHIALKICRTESSSSLYPPFSIEYGLQLHFASTKQEFFDSIKNLHPVYVCIQEDKIDELCFLSVEKEESDDNISRTIACINAKRSTKQHLADSTTPKGSCPSEKENSVLFSVHRIKLPTTENASNNGTATAEDMLTYLAQLSLLSNFQITTNHLRCYYFDVEVRIDVGTTEEYVQVSIRSEEEPVVCKLRKAIIVRIKDLLNSNDLQSRTVSLSKSCVVHSQLLYSELCTVASDEDYNIESLIRIYNKIRKDVSQCLPIV